MNRIWANIYAYKGTKWNNRTIGSGSGGGDDDDDKIDENVLAMVPMKIEKALVYACTCICAVSSFAMFYVCVCELGVSEVFFFFLSESTLIEINRWKHISAFLTLPSTKGKKYQQQQHTHTQTHP